MSVSCNSSSCSLPNVGVLPSLVSTLVQSLLVAQCAISPKDIWPKDYGESVLEEGSIGSYDFVIVGAGSAGSVVASRLSENPEWKVLVLESGGDPPQESEVPELMFTTQHSAYTWNHWTSPDGTSCLGMKNSSCYWPSGKMIGGSSGINGMLYLRGNTEDYDNWLQRGNRLWSWRQVRRYFQKSVHPAGNATHSQGYVSVNPFPRYNANIQQLIYAGAAELRVPRVREFDVGSELGYGNVPGTIENGRRFSAGKGFLSRVRNRANLHVIKNARATKINFDTSNTRVASVDFVLREDKRFTVPIGKELVVSAGSINSAKLLMLSGVGPKAHLNDLQIPVAHDLSVGNNLQDHILVPIFIKLNEYRAKPMQPRIMLDNIYDYLMHASGPLSGNNVHSLMAFLNTKRSRPRGRYPDVQLLHVYLQRGDTSSLKLLFDVSNFKEDVAKQCLKFLSTSDLLIVYVVLAHPKSEGNVRLISADYREPPKITPKYLSHPDDVETLVRGIKYLNELTKTRAFRANNAQLMTLDIEGCEGSSLLKENYWQCYVRHMSTTVYHPVGTVKLGLRKDKTACVNQRLRVHGTKNLRVIDASIMPSIPSCNTNGPTLMIGERGAEFIRRQWMSFQTDVEVDQDEDEDVKIWEENEDDESFNENQSENSFEENEYEKYLEEDLKVTENLQE